MGPGVLEQILSNIPKAFDPNLLVGYDGADDACVYKLSDELAVVQTVDFFPPMVDDPYIFGQVAAANALSDIYAMGARPTHAMNLLCYPNCLSPDEVGQILAGGYAKVAEAGAVIAGGHSIRDNEPKYGLCVSGVLHPDHILRNTGAQAGDKLILTKPLGSGVLNTAVKGELISAEQLAPAIKVMTTLNKEAAEIAAGFSIHACTDVTGFGLLGHAFEMVDGSGLGLRLEASRLPLIEGALDLAEMGIIPAGAYNNRDYLQGRVRIGADVPLALADLCFDPQTSGGLLFAVAPEQGEELLAALRSRIPEAALIGSFVPLPQDGAAAEEDKALIELL